MASKTETPVSAYFGHHKCATMWTNQVLRTTCRRMGLKYAFVHDFPDSELRGRMFESDLEGYVRKNRVDFLSYSDPCIDFVKQMKSMRGFHVIRDPRDILISSYYSHLRSHTTEGWPALVGHRKCLEELSKEEGLLKEIDFIDKLYKDLNEWDYDQPNILELKMEDLTRDPYNSFLSIFGFLDLLDEGRYSPYAEIKSLTAEVVNMANQGGKLPLRAPRKRIHAERLLGVVYQFRFSEISKRVKNKPDQTASHYRSGKSGDWADHFTPKCKAVFKERHNDLLIKLGYAADGDW